VRQLEPRLKASPAGFEVGSERSQRADQHDSSIFRIIGYQINPFVCRGGCGYMGEDEHSSASRAGSGSGGSGAGRQNRSSRYPQALSYKPFKQGRTSVSQNLSLRTKKI